LESVSGDKELLRDPGRLWGVLSDRLKLHPSTESVKVAGVKPLQGNTIKIFMDNERATVLREDHVWLKVCRALYCKENIGSRFRLTPSQRKQAVYLVSAAGKINWRASATFWLMKHRG
jgi:hypothetical protein